MKQIKLSELKIGDKLIDSEPSQYGFFTNRIITEIKKTKSGRIKIKYSYDYIHADGSKTTNHSLNYSNGALIPESLISIQ